MIELLGLYALVISVLYLRSRKQVRDLYRREAEALSWAALEKGRRVRAEDALESSKPSLKVIQGGRN